MTRAATIKIFCLLPALCLTGCRILPRLDPPFRNLGRQHPDNPHALFMEGKSYLAQGEPRQAAKRFRAALRLQANFEEARLGLAHAYREARSYKRALKVYRQVCETSPRNAQALEGMAIVLIRLHKHEEARPLLEQVVEEIDRRSVSALNALAELHYDRREYRRALDYWKRSLELDGSQNKVRALYDDLRGYVGKYVPEGR